MRRWIIAPAGDNRPVGEQSLSEKWDAKAGEWTAWARSPTHDVFFKELNWPAFRELLPAPGTATLDLGCGEGRVGRELASAGHRLSGADSSPALIAAAERAGGYERLVCADAAELPFADASFDLAVAFMSLQDMERPAEAIGELARVLSPGGCAAIAIVHPFNRSPEGLEDYFGERHRTTAHERDGLPIVFEETERPLVAYTGPLADAGFVIEQLREPQAIGCEPPDPLVPAGRRPYFLHMRCRLDRAGGPLPSQLR
jgi:SAM-dependent methyltransferase